MKTKVKCIVLSLLIGGVFAFCYEIGARIELAGYLDLSDKTIFINLLWKTLLFSTIIYVLWQFGNTFCTRIASKFYTSKIGLFCEKHRNYSFPSWGNILILLLLWTPVFLSIFPGAFAYDAYDEWMQVKNNMITSHHPVLHVLFVGLCLEIAYAIWASYNVGIAIYTVIQMFLLAGIFSYTLSFLKRYGIPSWIRMFVLLYWGTSPTVQLFAVSVTKDTLFAGAFLIFLLCLFDIKCRTEDFFANRKRKAVFLLSALGTMILRNNGLYVVIILLVLLCVIYRFHWKQLFPLILSIVACYMIYTGPVYNLLNVEAGGIQEMLSVPLQQMARTYNNSYEELAPEETQMLEALIPKEDLKAYRPKVADFVKTNFQAEVFENNITGYLKLWAKWGLEHPLTYINSFLINTVDFWYPKAVVDGYEYGGGETDYFDYSVNEPGTRISILPKVHEYYTKISSDRDTAQNPFVQLLMNPGVFLLIFIYIGGYFLYRDRKEFFLPWLAVMLSWLTVLLGPIALIRYVLIFYFALPVFLSLSIQKEQTLTSI